MRPDKRLGQHFLRDPSVLEEIAGLADVARSRAVLEIGPGEGALTAFLLRAGRPVVAVDTDRRAGVAVQERFGDRVHFMLGDALKVDFMAALEPFPGEGLPVIVGNLPYNVGTAIYRRLLTLRYQVSRVILLLQKEVAHRICAGPGSRTYGLLSVVTALSARAMLVRDVPPEAFFPEPKVTSSIIYVDFPGTFPLEISEHAAFSNFVGRFFQMRRKKISRLIPDTDVLRHFELDGALRPEFLPPETYLRLFREGSWENGVLVLSDDGPSESQGLAVSEDAQLK